MLLGEREGGECVLCLSCPVLTVCSVDIVLDVSPNEGAGIVLAHSICDSYRTFAGTVCVTNGVRLSVYLYPTPPLFGKPVDGCYSEHRGKSSLYALRGLHPLL